MVLNPSKGMRVTMANNPISGLMIKRNPAQSAIKNPKVAAYNEIIPEWDLWANISIIINTASPSRLMTVKSFHETVWRYVSGLALIFYLFYK